MRMMGLLAVLMVSAGTFTAAATAGTPGLEWAITACAGKADADARLACYDTIAASLGTATAAPAAAPVAPAAAPQVAAVPPAPAAAPAAPAPAAVGTLPVATASAAPPPPKTETASDFGSERLPRETLRAAGKPDPLDEIHGTIKEIRLTPLGRAIVTLNNGQVWRQTDGDGTKFRGKAGEAITIERGFLNSYNLIVEGRSGLIKVRRIE